MAAVLRKNMRRYFEEGQTTPMKIDIRWERDPLPRTVTSMGGSTTVSKELASIEREFMELGEVFKPEPEMKVEEKPKEVKKVEPPKKEELVKEQKSPEKPVKAQAAVVRAIPTGELYAVKTNVTKERMERNGGVTTLVPVLDEEKPKENVEKTLTEKKETEEKTEKTNKEEVEKNKENEKKNKEDEEKKNKEDEEKKNKEKKNKENEKKNNEEETTKSEKKVDSMKSKKSSSKKKKTKRPVLVAAEAPSMAEDVAQGASVAPIPPVEKNTMTRSAYLDAEMNKRGSIGNKETMTPMKEDTTSSSVTSAYLSPVMDKPSVTGVGSVSLAVPDDDPTVIEKKPKSERSKKSSKRSKRKKNGSSKKKRKSGSSRKKSSSAKEPAPVQPKTEEAPKSVDVTQMSLMEKNTMDQVPKEVPPASALLKAEDAPNSVDITQMSMIEKSSMDKQGSTGGDQVVTPLKKNADGSVRSAYLSPAMDKPNAGGVGSVSLAVGNVPEVAKEGNGQEPVAPTPVPTSSDVPKDSTNPTPVGEGKAVENVKQGVNPNTRSLYLEPTMQKEGAVNLETKELTTPMKTGVHANTRILYLSPDMEKTGGNLDAIQGQKGAGGSEPSKFAQEGAGTPGTPMANEAVNTTKEEGNGQEKTPAWISSDAPKESAKPTLVGEGKTVDDVKQGVNPNTRSLYLEPTMQKEGAVNLETKVTTPVKTGVNANTRSLYLSPDMEKTSDAIQGQKGAGGSEPSKATQEGAGTPGTPMTNEAVNTTKEEGNGQEKTPAWISSDAPKESAKPTLVGEGKTVDDVKQGVNPNTRSLYLEPTMQKEGAVKETKEEVTTPMKTGANTRSLYLSPDMEKTSGNVNAIQGQKGAVGSELNEATQEGAGTPKMNEAVSTTKTPKVFTPSLYMDVNIAKLGENHPGLNQQAPQGPPTSNTRSLYLEPTMEKGNVENQALIGEAKATNENQKIGNGAQLAPEVAKEGGSVLPIGGHSATTKSKYLDVDVNKLGEIEGNKKVVSGEKKTSESSVRSAYLSPVMGKPGVTDESGTRSAYFDKNLAKEGGGPTEQTTKPQEGGGIGSVVQETSIPVLEQNTTATPKDSNITSAYMEPNVAKDVVVEKKETVPAQIGSTRSLYLEPTMQKENMVNLETTGKIKEGGEAVKTGSNLEETAKVENGAPQPNSGTKSVYAEPIIHKDVENAAIMDQKKDM